MRLRERGEAEEKLISAHSIVFTTKGCLFRIYHTHARPEILNKYFEVVSYCVVAVMTGNIDTPYFQICLWWGLNLLSVDTNRRPARWFSGNLEAI